MRKRYLKTTLLCALFALSVCFTGCKSTEKEKEETATGQDADIASADVAKEDTTETLAGNDTEDDTTEIDTEDEVTETDTEEDDGQSGSLNDKPSDTTSNNNNSSNNSSSNNNSNNNNSSNNNSSSNNSSSNNNSNNNNSSNSNSHNNSNNNNSNSNNSNNNSNSHNNNNTTEATTQETVTESGYSIDYAQSVLNLVNEQRRAAGLSDLQLDYTLMTAAQIRAKECSESFSHTRPDGSSCFTAWNVSYSSAGENIAAGYWSAEAVVDGWMNSEGHKANILNPSFTHMAVGCWYDPNSAYGYYWAQCFVGR